MNVQCLWWVVLGFVPFVNFGRVGSVVSFWPEWASACLYLLALLALVWRKSEPLALVWRPVGVWALGMMALLLLQWGLGMVHSVAATLSAIWVLVLIFFLDVAVQNCPRDDLWVRRADAWSYGVLLAFGYHFCVTAMGFWGFDLVYFQVRPMDVPWRALGAFGQPNQLGVFSVLTLLVASYLFWRRKLAIGLWAVAYVCVIVLVALTFSRAAMLCAAALGLVCVGCALRSSGARVRSLRWLGVACMALALVAFVLGNPVRNLIAGMQPSSVSESVMNRAGSNLSRMEQLADGAALGFSHPWLGVGHKRYAEARLFELQGPLLEPNVGYPHNLIIHLFAEFGFSGLLWTFGMLMWFAWQKFRHRDLLHGGVGVPLMVGWVLVMLLYSMVEFPLMYLFFLLPTLGFASALSTDVRSPLPAVRVGRTPALLALLIWASLLAWSAVDYRRIDVIHTAVLSKESAVNGVLKEEVVRDVSELSASSLFQYQATTLWLFVGGMNPIFVDEKIEAARFVMTTVPTAKTMARYVGLLLLAMRDEEAVKFIDALRPRNAVVADGLLKELRMLSRTSHDLRVAMIRNGLLVSTEPPQ